MQPVADPEFPRAGVPTYYLTNFSRKLHENEEILAQFAGARDSPSPPPSPPDPPMTTMVDW